MARTDIIVLGAGIVGTSIALHLAKRGLSVALVDRGNPGEGTSYGNAGIIEGNTIFPPTFPSDLSMLLRIALKRSPLANYHLSYLPQIAPWLLAFRVASQPARLIENAQLMRPLFARAVAEHEALAAEAGAERYLSRRGWLKIYRSEGALGALALELELAAKLGITNAPLDREGALAIEPALAPVFRHAVHWTGAVSVSNPLALTRAYAGRFAMLGGQTLSGQATVLVEPLAGQASSTELVFAAFWAPSAVFGTESSLLSSIADCYGPEQGSLYRIFQDAAFTYMMPPGWSVTSNGETANSLLLTDGQEDFVGYALLQSISTFQFDSPQSLIDAYLANVQITSVTSLWSVTPPAQGGGSGNTEYEEFTGTLEGNPVHGVIYGQATNAGGFYTGVVRLGLALAANWNAVNGALIQMAGFIQHDFTQDLQTINQINQQWQSFSNQVANFDDILNNQQLTQDPMTGIYYDAPYDSYEVEGPNGPGYYNNDQLLNIINRP